MVSIVNAIEKDQPDLHPMTTEHADKLGTRVAEGFQMTSWEILKNGRNVYISKVLYDNGEFVWTLHIQSLRIEFEYIEEVDNILLQLVSVIYKHNTIKHKR